MDIEEAKKLLAERDLKIVKFIEGNEECSLFLCRRKNGTEIEAAIQNGIVIIAPTEE